MSKKLFVNTEYDCNNLSRLRFPSPEELKVVIWDKELCNDAEWNDFLECVEEKTKENAELKKQLAEKEKEIEKLKEQRHIYLNRSVEECNKITDLEFELQHKDQDKISFAVDVFEEIADCSNYINSKLDFECGSYVSEKAIRDKIKYLKGKVEDVKD